MDVGFFTFFFFCWTMIFSFLYRVQGIEIDDEDYQNVNTYAKFALQIFRNSIGDNKTPLYSFWSSHISDHYFIATSMISYSWILWLSNQFFMLIILLNFLIAIIG